MLPNVLLEFGKDHIDQILNHADTIFTVDDIMESVDIWKKTHANDVLEIFGKVFADIDVPVQCIEEEESDEDSPNEAISEIVDDPSFLELLNETEWALESFSLNYEQDSLLDESAI